MTPISQLPNLIHTDFWFNDGNIILVAQNAAFKVHKPPPSLSIQSSRSSAKHGKADAVGNGVREAERARDDLIDGCPFVVLQDSLSDVFYFLSALYDGL
jgi:hypothetical protein